MRKTYRDEFGRTLGYSQETHGKITLYDQLSKELGFYDTRKNETWQSFPRKLIAREGNILAQLFIKKF